MHMELNFGVPIDTRRGILKPVPAPAQIPVLEPETRGGKNKPPLPPSGLKVAGFGSNTRSADRFSTITSTTLLADDAWFLFN